MAEKAQQGEPTRRSSRNVFPKRYDNGSDSAGSDGDVDFDDEEGTRRRGRPKKILTPGSGPGTGGKPKLDPADKKRGRPSKEIVWDDNYTGPLRRCAYIGHEDLWGPDVPVDLQPQYFYATTARCIYCYKHLCNERHANKSKDKGSSGKKKSGRGRRGDDDDDDDMDDDEDEVITPTASTRRGRAASRNKRSKGEEEWTGPSPRRPTPSQPRPTPVAAAANPPPNVLHNAETAQRNFLEGPRILQEWNAPAHATLEYSNPPEGAQSLQLKLASAPQQLDFGHCLPHTNQSLLINSSPQSCCVGWVSPDVLVVGGGSSLHVWSGLQTNSPSFSYTLVLEGGPVSSFIVLPRSGVPKVRYAAVGAVHADGKVRLHSLPIPNIVDQQPLLLRQLSPSPTSAPSTSRVHSLAVSTHPAHPNRLILGHEDGSLRWIDLPPNPGPELPPCQGNGGAGFSIASAGYLPTSDAAFWAVGDSASVAIGDIREPFGGPAAPPAANANTEAFLKTADSSVVFPALVAGGDGGHVWALPWAGEHTPPPRLLCSLNGAALSIRCHPFLPLAMAGCASGAARALWLPVQNAAHKSQQQLIVHAASAEDRNIVIDSPADLSDQGFRHSSPLSCVSVAWAPDVDGKYACAHANGLVRVGNVREFVLRSAK